MAITTAERNQIVELTVLMFNAAPGETYLAQIVALYESNGRSLQNLANQLAGTSIFQSMHPNFETAEEFAAEFLTPLGLQNDATARDFVIAKVNAGVPKGQIMYEGYVALNAVPSTGAAQYVAANAILNNKTTVAEYYSTNGGGATTLDALQAVIASVNSTDASVTAAINAISGGGSLGQTFVLTTTVDTLTGTTDNDVFVADNTGATATSSPADTINGGGGTDTIKVFAKAGSAVLLPTLSSVENVLVSGDNQGLNVSALAGVTSLAVESTSVAGAAIAYTLGSGQSLTLKAVTDTGNTGNDLDVNAAASVTAQTITVDGAGSTSTAADDLEIDINGTGVATLNLVTANNASNISLINTGAAIKTLNISGDKAVTIRNSFDPAGATGGTINASAMTGDLTFSVATANEAITFTGGSGKNSLTTGTASDTLTGGSGNDTLDAGTGNDIVKGMGGNDTLTVGGGTVNVDGGDGDDTVLVTGLDSTDVLQGGAGTDTLGLAFGDADLADAATTAGAALRATASGFEQLRVTDNITGALNVGTLGFNYVQVGADVTAGGAVNGLTTGATVEYRTAANMAAALAVGVKDAALTTDDAVNIKLHADLANADNFVTQFGVNGVNVVNVHAVDRVDATATTDNGPDDGYTLQLSDAANLNFVNVTGSAMVNYTLGAGTNAVRVLDWSASTGNATIDVSAFAGTERVTIKGSQGVNVITGDDAAFGEAIFGGAKGDTITAGAGTDAITGGGGRDAFVALDGQSVVGAVDTIADFGKVTEAVLAGDVTAMANVAAFQATATAKGGANADLLDIGTAAATLGGAQAATTVVGAISGGTGAETVNAIETAKGLLTLSGADAALINTLGEWVGVADIMAAAAGNVVAFEFNGNTYVFQQAGATDNLVQLTGVTGVTGVSIAGGAVAAAIGDIFVM